MTTITVIESVPVPGSKEGETRIVSREVEVLDTTRNGILPEKDSFAIGLVVQASTIASA
jgi:hypothetical protein